MRFTESLKKAKSEFNILCIFVKEKYFQLFVVVPNKPSDIAREGKGQSNFGHCILCFRQVEKLLQNFD